MYIRTRLALWFILIMSIVLVAFSIAIYNLLHANLLADIDSDVRQRAAILRLAALPEPGETTLRKPQLDVSTSPDIYLQVLDGKDPVVNFMRGTALRPFLSVLPEPEAAKFIEAFAERMAAAYPPQPNGQTLFPFRRLFLVAQR